MSTSFDADDVEDEHGCYPVDADALEGFAQVAHLVRMNLSNLDPHHLRTAAVTLLALERLPRVTSGINVVFGFRTPMERGCWAWADISIGRDGIRLGTGEHFYDPGVGGDTESRTRFQAYSGGYEGSVQEWLELASMIFPDGVPSAEDYSDHDSIDWTV
jgi:hypothetical protein